MSMDDDLTQTPGLGQFFRHDPCMGLGSPFLLALAMLTRSVPTRSVPFWLLKQTRLSSTNASLGELFTRQIVYQRG